MIRQCKQKKIDIVLTKSISRFARNTVDCLKYVRALRELGIAVIFEKENINTLETDSEMLITLLGAFAQAESESISANVRWGKRQAMREGRVTINYKRWHAYEKGPDGQPELDYERAQIVWDMGLRLLAGASLRQLKAWLEERQIPNIDGGYEWTISAIRSILSDVKNCGDILMQKTFTRDCISRKVVKNTGQLPMYLIKDHHEPIFDRDTSNAIQAELARRNARRSPSKKNASTGKGCYASKYALSERLVCGECGTLYRRCTWSRNGKKRVVWRCVSRLDYGTKYCHDSPTLDEEPLQKSILAAINSAMSDKGTLIRDITGAMELELAPIPGETMSIADIDRRLEEIKQEFGTAFQEASKAINGNAYLNTFKSLSDEMAALREKRTLMEQQQQENTETTRRIKQAVTAMEEAPAELADWNESEIRQLVDTVKVLSANQIEVYLRGGILITQDMIK